MFGELERGQLIGRCEAVLADQGLRVEEVSDYERVIDIAARAGKKYLTPVVSPLANDLMQGNCIWLVAWREDYPVMLGGARLEDLGSETVSNFWPRSLARLYNRPMGELISNICPYVSDRLRGRLAYFGDLHVAPGFRGKLSGVRAFVTMGHLAVSLKWDPEFTYAFIREKDVMRGAADRYGFLDHYPLPIQWINPPAPRSNSEWCCAIPRDRLASMARATVQAIAQSSSLSNEGGVGKDLLAATGV